jgi:cell division septation protein DedD
MQASTEGQGLHPAGHKPEDLLPEIAQGHAYCLKDRQKSLLGIGARRPGESTRYVSITRPTRFQSWAAPARSEDRGCAVAAPLLAVRGTTPDAWFRFGREVLLSPLGLRDEAGLCCEVLSWGGKRHHDTPDRACRPDPRDNAESLKLVRSTVPDRNPRSSHCACITLRNAASLRGGTEIHRPQCRDTPTHEKSTPVTAETTPSSVTAEHPRSPHVTESRAQDGDAAPAQATPDPERVAFPRRRPTGGAW